MVRLKIGNFARLGQVSVKLLRYYEIGLLKPAQVDDASSYRYYAMDQLPRLNRILALKDLGLSLEQVAMVLHADLPVDISNCLCYHLLVGAFPRIFNESRTLNVNAER